MTYLPIVDWINDTIYNINSGFVATYVPAALSSRYSIIRLLEHGDEKVPVVLNRSNRSFRIDQKI